MSPEPEGPPQTIKRWQDCQSFTDALVARQYLSKDATGNLKTCMPEGVYLYMWELWQDGWAAAWAAADLCEHGRESGCCLRCSMAGPKAQV